MNDDLHSKRKQGIMMEIVEKFETDECEQAIVQ